VFQSLIPFIDLKPVENDVRSRMEKVIQHGQHIMGPEVFDIAVAA
jgi:hypothetical protein